MLIPSFASVALTAILLQDGKRSRSRRLMLFSYPSNNNLPDFVPRENDSEDEQYYPALESPMYTEDRMRYSDTDAHLELRFAATHQNDWGVEHHSPPPRIFPDTAESVSEGAFQAIAATLYNQQKLDPNVVRNAYNGDTLFGRCPIRRVWDAGRIGVEIDGAGLLFCRSSSFYFNRSRANRIGLDHKALRHVALKLAEKLSKSPWLHESNTQASQSSRPVLLYFNQIKQSLEASREILLFNQKAVEKGDRTAFSNVTIHTLSDSSLPDLWNIKPSSGRARYSKLSKGQVDPTRAIILVVQPTDFNDEYRPPGPAIGVIEAFQQLSAQAMVAEIPVVCLSPRFLVQHSPLSTGWDQSGYQQSSSFGGVEPPAGPSPWFLRDYHPPVFSWVGNALPLKPSETAFRDKVGKESCYSRVVLFQSVLDDSHSWHLYTRKESLRDYESQAYEHHYLASTNSASGRPTREVMRRLFGEFAPYC